MRAGRLWEVQQQALKLPRHGLRVPGPDVRFLLRLHQRGGVSVCAPLSYRAPEMGRVRPRNSTGVLPSLPDFINDF